MGLVPTSSEEQDLNLTKQVNEFVNTFFDQLNDLSERVAELERVEKTDLDFIRSDRSTDIAPDDDTTTKRLGIQKLSSPPSNAAYIAFTNSPGAEVFYIVLEQS